MLVLLVAYNFWAASDRMQSVQSLFPRYVIGNFESYGTNAGKGNILALAPYLHTYDFSSEEAFYNMMHYYLSLVQQKKLLNDSTVVVLPEYIGTWLVAVNEKAGVYKDTSLTDAMKSMVYSNLGKFGWAYLFTVAKEKNKEAVFKMKAPKMLDIYQRTFSALAKEFGITIVAGSIVLPDPSVQKGKIEIHKGGALFNCSAVFDKNGNVMAPLTIKRFPIEEEKSFTAGAVKEDIPVYKTPSGNLVVLICADAWYPECFKAISNKKIDLLAIPSFVSGNNTMQEKWHGYSGAPTPADVDKGDMEQITEQEAWMKYSAQRVASMQGLQVGMHVFLRGDWWNMGSDGNTILSRNKDLQLTKTPEEKTGTLVNYWLSPSSPIAD